MIAMELFDPGKAGYKIKEFSWPSPGRLEAASRQY